MQVSHSSTHGTGSRCATRNTTPHLRSSLCQKQVLSPASSSTSSNVPLSLSCVCVTFLMTGGSCRSLLCRSVFSLVLVATCSDLWCFLDELVCVDGRSLPLRTVCVLVLSWQPRFGLDVAVPCLFSVTPSRECLAMPLCGPCCPPRDSWVSSLRA